MFENNQFIYLKLGGNSLPLTPNTAPSSTFQPDSITVAAPKTLFLKVAPMVFEKGNDEL